MEPRCETLECLLDRGRVLGGRAHQLQRPRRPRRAPVELLGDPGLPLVERLERLLPELRNLRPEEIGSRVLARVDEFLGEARLGDDLSLAIIVKN